MKEKEVKIAIKNLEKALNDCGKLGIRICGMDDGLVYATDEMIAKTPDAGNNYCTVADAYKAHAPDEAILIGEIKAKGIYIDSGGW